MRRVLATDFGIWPMFQKMDQIADRMITSPEYSSRLANYLLLYDQIIIPTGNLLVVPILRSLLGDDAFDELIRNKGIVLARFDHWFGYVGNGGGISFLRMGDAPHLGPNLVSTFFKSTDEAVNDIIAATLPHLTSESRSRFTNLLKDNIVDLPFKTISNGLKDETYNDILKSPYLQDLLSLRNAGRSLNNLIGLEANQIKLSNPHFPSEPGDSPEISSILRVMFENFLFSIGSYVEATEITGDESSLTLLKAKGQRLGFAPDLDQSFTQIQKVNGVPDIGVAFSKKQLSCDQLLDLRYSKHCQALRDWFAEETLGKNSVEVVHHYIESLGKPSWIDQIPTKLLRFATTSLLGAVEPVSGGLLSAVDTFLLSKWFPTKSPRLFLEQAKVMLANSPVIKKANMQGRNRNSLCSCGSGKKLKKCCGR